MSVVHYKFTNNLEYKTITFDGLSISLGDLKRAIMAQNKSKSGGFDLEIKNAQTKEEYKDDSMQIPKNASVVIRRIRRGPKQKPLTAMERPESPGNLGTKPTEDQADQIPPTIPLSKLNKVADLANANASEDDKIAAMINQAGEDWDPSLYAKARGRYSNVPPRGPPPAHYLCFRCRKPGHWIQNCPTNGDPNYDMKVRRTTGIPKSFLRLADNPTQKGALLIAETGQYAVPIVDHHGYEEAASKKRLKGLSTVGGETEKAIPKEYLCPICKKIMNNAVVIPCCGESFCDECVVSYLLEKEHVCPSCEKESISPDSIVVNKHLRQAIIKFRSSNQDSSFSATSSPSAHFDEDSKQESISSVPVSVPLSTSTSAVTATSATITEQLPSSDTVVTTLAESSQLKSVDSNASKTPQIATSLTTTSSAQLGSSDSQAKDTSNTTTVSKDTVSDARLKRAPQPEHQVSEGYVQPLRIPGPSHGPVSLQPIPRPAYVVAGAAIAHHHHSHHAMVHRTGRSMGIPPYGHLPHLGLLPGPPPVPYGALGPDLGLMMNEEEFYRAKKKLSERGRRKHRSDDDKKKRKKDRSRSRRRRDRRESPAPRRSPPTNDFAFELSKYKAMQRDRLRRRSRSRSWTPSGSSSRSNSSWSHSWSRSKSPSRSYSRSKSRTPVNWDRSRSSSPFDKNAKPVRSDEESKKRKKHGKDPAKKRPKTDLKAKDDIEKSSQKTEARAEKPAQKSQDKMKELTGKGRDSKDKPSKKKESRNKTSRDMNDATKKKERKKGSEIEELYPSEDQMRKGERRSSSPVVVKTAKTEGKTKKVKRKDSSSGEKISKMDDKKKKERSRGTSSIEHKTDHKQEKIKLESSEDSTSPKGKKGREGKKAGQNKKVGEDDKKISEDEKANEDKKSGKEGRKTSEDRKTREDKKKKESKMDSNKTPKDKSKARSKRETEPVVSKKIAEVKKKDSTKGNSDAELRDGSSESKHSSIKDKSLKHLDTTGKKYLKRKVDDAIALHAKKRDEGEAKREKEKAGEKQKIRKEEKRKKRRKSVSDDENDENREDRRLSPKRPKDDENEMADFRASEVSDKGSKSRKKKRYSVDEEHMKGSRHKKRKHKKKHKKHKHRKRSKRKEKEKTKREKGRSSEATSSVDSENELDDRWDNSEDNESGEVRNLDHGGQSSGNESSKSELGLTESDNSGAKEEDSGSEEKNIREGGEDRDNGSGDGVSLPDDEMESEDEEDIEGEVDEHGGDVAMENVAEEEDGSVEGDEDVEEEGTGDEVEEEWSEGQEEAEEPDDEEKDSDVGVSEEEEEVEELEDHEVEDEEEDQKSNEAEDSEDEQQEVEDEDEDIEEDEDEEVEEEEEAVGEFDENEENEEDDQEQGKDNVTESGDEVEIMGDKNTDDECNIADDEALLEAGTDEEVCSENDDDMQQLLQEDTVCESKLIPEEKQTTQQELTINEVEEENLNLSVKGVEVKQVSGSDLIESELKGVMEEFGHNKDEEAAAAKQGVGEIVCSEETIKDICENKEITSNDTCEATVFVGSDQKSTETFETKSQLDIMQRNGIGVKDTTVDTRPKNAAFRNCERFDSGVDTLPSQDSIPDFDDPNYTDFSGDPIIINNRRTSSDILQALINEETEDDF